jgi:hypothetical protein
MAHAATRWIDLLARLKQGSAQSEYYSISTAPGAVLSDMNQPSLELAEAILRPLK